MKNIIWILIVLSALSFVLAMVCSIAGTNISIFRGITSAEGYSNASTNLALIAIALHLISEKK